MSGIHAMKAETVGCQFPNSVVNFERKKLMTFLRRMRAAADVATPRRLRPLLTTCWCIVVRGWSLAVVRCRRRYFFHSFTLLNYGPCLDHVDEIVKGEGDTF